MTYTLLGASLSTKTLSPKPPPDRLTKENERLKERVKELERERTHMIPVEEVHGFLDRLDLSRLAPGGTRLLISQRVDVLVRRATALNGYAYSPMGEGSLPETRAPKEEP